MADKILRRTSYGGEQTENLAPIIQINRHTKTASSEPKLFMKGTVFSRQKAMRHTFRFQSQQDPNAKAELPRQFSEGSDLSERSKLQRQKAQSRKTFKLRKTRKDQRKLKTTCEPLEMTSSSALDMQPSSGATGLSGQNTVILNPALHSAAGLSKKSSMKIRQKKGSRPPALVLAKEPCPGSAGPNLAQSQTSPNWKVTFPDIEIHSPKDDQQQDNLSISSRGTSSTMGYSVSDTGMKWDSFGENEEGGLLSLQDIPQGSPGLPSASTAADRPSSSSTLVATPSSSSTSSVILQTTRDHTSAYVSSQTRRKNYIIFEQNDEDTLI
jgi:hypothetical protein